MTTTLKERMKTKWMLTALLWLVARNSFAQDPAADDFERASLGGNWQDQGGGTAAIVNGHDLGTITGTGVAVVWTNSLIFDADQFCEAVLADEKSTNLLTQVFLRRRSSDGARYGFHFTDEDGAGGIGNPRWGIKYDGVPTAQTRNLATVPATMPMPRDTLRIEVRGTSPVLIKGFHNGLEVIVATDTAPDRIPTSGIVGVVSRRRIGSTAPPNSPVFASWRGGSLGPVLDMQRVGLSATNLTLVFATMTNRTYTVQCAESLSPPAWEPLINVSGDGTAKSVTLTNVGPQRFYRVRVN